MLTPLLAAICIAELIAILALSACVVTQRHTKQEELNTIISETRTKADGISENTSGPSQRMAILLYGIADRLEAL